ncbi:MAG: 1,4-dihydroxy-2-naphthoate octaprenyltransferase [Crocinitomicaceae bacterium]|nr:1,4-dihydroxy-2-naphthoate octaprenyltransferase [Crocinitomicaceae bacterium]
MAIRDWIQASRLRTLPLAASCVLVGAAIGFPIAQRSEMLSAQFWPVFLSILLTVVLLQVLSNWANDLGDFENGADDFSRQDRSVASGRISPEAMKKAVVVLALIAFASGLVALFLAFFAADLLVPALVLLVIGVASIAAAFRYTAGKSPYGYKGYGDVMVFLFFGWIGVGGTAVLLSHQWDFQWLLPATWSGAMSVAVLNLNNMRDHISDAKAGKNTIVVRMGFAWSRRYHLVLFLVGWLSWWAYALVLHAGEWRGMGWIAVLNAVHFAHVFRVFNAENPQELDPELKRVALSSAVAALFFLMAQTGLVAP